MPNKQKKKGEPIPRIIQAGYGNTGKNPRFCAKHKPSDDYILVGRTFCKHPDHPANKPVSAAFGDPNAKKPKLEWCSVHAPKGYIDLVKKRCLNCEIEVAHYGYPKDYDPNKTATFDNEKLPVDVKLFCKECKLPDMVITRPKKRCETCEAVTGWIKHEGKVWCRQCIAAEYPDDERIAKKWFYRQTLITNDLLALIRQEIPAFKYTSVNQRIRGGKSLCRPDIFIDKGKYCIIIEIDEQQHASYERDYHEKRLEILKEDIGHKPLVMINFNPDHYYLDERKKKMAKGMFQSRSSKSNKTPEYEARLKVLFDMVMTYLKTPQRFKGVKMEKICYNLYN